MFMSDLSLPGFCLPQSTLAPSYWCAQAPTFILPTAVVFSSKQNEVHRCRGALSWELLAVSTKDHPVLDESDYDASATHVLSSVQLGWLPCTCSHKPQLTQHGPQCKSVNIWQTKHPALGIVEGIMTKAVPIAAHRAVLEMAPPLPMTSAPQRKPQTAPKCPPSVSGVRIDKNFCPTSSEILGDFWPCRKGLHRATVHFALTVTPRELKHLGGTRTVTGVGIAWRGRRRQRRRCAGVGGGGRALADAALDAQPIVSVRQLLEPPSQVALVAEELLLLQPPLPLLVLKVLWTRSEVWEKLRLTQCSSCICAAGNRFQLSSGDKAQVENCEGCIETGAVHYWIHLLSSAVIQFININVWINQCHLVPRGRRQNRKNKPG